jgi:hypothetical protein
MHKKKLDNETKVLSDGKSFSTFLVNPILPARELFAHHASHSS